MSQNFKPAPPGVVAIIWTLGFLGGFAFFVVRVTLAASPDLYDAGGALILLVCIIYAWARSPKSYRVSEGELNIDRVGMKSVNVPLHMVTSVQANPDVGNFFNRSMLSIGGLFGWGGKTNVRKPMDVNSMEAYVYGANPKNSVLFQMEGGKNIIVTPADPQAFLAAIRKSSVRPATTSIAPSTPVATSKKKRKRA